VIIFSGSRVEREKRVTTDDTILFTDTIIILKIQFLLVPGIKATCLQWKAHAHAQDLITKKRGEKKDDDND